MEVRYIDTDRRLLNGQKSMDCFRVTPVLQFEGLKTKLRVRIRVVIRCLYVQCGGVRIVYSELGVFIMPRRCNNSTRAAHKFHPKNC